MRNALLCVQNRAERNGIMGYIIGVDLGGTKIHTALSTKEGTLLSECVLKTSAEEGDIKVLNRILESIRNVMKEKALEISDIEAIGIGAPGLVDVEAGKILMAANLPFENYDLRGKVAEAFPVPVLLMNDGNAALLGEYWFGTKKGTKNLVYITVSTGVGGAAMVDGKLLSGAKGLAFEIGHMPLVPDSTVPCGCGQFGHVEAYVSGTGIRLAAERALAAGETSLLQNYETFGTREIHEASLQGDGFARNLLEEAYRYLGMSVSMVMTLLNPEVILLGGGVSFIGESFMEGVKESAKAHTLPLIYESCELLPSTFRDKTGVMGAAACAMEALKKNQH